MIRDGLHKLDSRAWRIAAGYAVFAALWILLSDYVLALLIPDPERMVRIGVYKGVAFVAVTAVLLLIVLRRVFGALERNYESLKAHEETARSERQFSDTMIESMPGVLYFYNEEGGFLRWNRNFEFASGYTGAEIARMHPLQFIAPEDQPRVAERIGEVFSRGISSVEAPFRAKDGRTTPYFFTGCRVMFQGRPCLVGVGIDITERRQAEQALRDLNRTLERQVADRTSELESARERAEESDRMKSAFLATMSHELRTPLNSIIGFTGILLQNLAGPLNPEQAKQLGMVQGSARHLLELINDVLDLSKIEAGQLQVNVAPFDLRESIDQVVGMMRPLAERKSLSLAVEVAPGLPQMNSDRRRVEQILLNLLNNAIKFTDRGSVRLVVERVEDYRLRSDSAIGPALRFRVIDTGIGIQPDDFASLFMPFRQLDSGLTRQHEGTGLGLAICRRLAELLDGEVGASSKPGAGSEFFVTLPLAMSS